MNTDAFYEVLATTNLIALATSIENIPNVRLVNFCYDKKKPEILYFATDRENQKVKEFGVNPKIAFTTVPLDGQSIPHIRSQKASVRKSDMKLSEVQDLFIAKVPGYDETIQAIGESLDVYEIHIQEAIVILGFDSVETVIFK